MANHYPAIFVHGILGFGPEEMGKLDYWKTAFKLDFPVQRHQASVGPLSSAHDRACEVAAQIRGTRVDYGEHHSNNAGHDQYGTDYSDRKAHPECPFVESWDEEHPVHLIGHSLGSPTIRCLQHLLEEDYWGWGSSHRWIHSISTISGVSNGSPLVYLFDADEETGFMPQRGFGAKLLELIELYHAAIGRPFDLESIYDFDLDHWGFNREEDEPLLAFLDRISRSHFMWGRDNASYSLSLQGAYADNGVWNTYPDTYYFSYITEQTWRNRFTGRYHPKPTMRFLMWRPALYIGHKKFERPPIPVDDFNASDWWENDGLVSTYSQMYPRTNGNHPVGGEMNAMTPVELLRPGRWFYQWERGMDHTDICVFPTRYQEHRLEAFYLRLFERLTMLPEARAAAAPPLDDVLV